MSAAVAYKGNDIIQVISHDKVIMWILLWVTATDKIGVLC